MAIERRIVSEVPTTLQAGTEVFVTAGDAIEHYIGNSEGEPVKVSGGGGGITPVLTSLPEPDASKAGEEFYLNGTLWTYAQANQFGTLAEGTPWPVKGYKEIVISIVNSGQTFDSSLFILVKTDADIKGLNFPVSGSGSGGEYNLIINEVQLENAQISSNVTIGAIKNQAGPSIVVSNSVPNVSLTSFGDEPLRRPRLNIDVRRIDTGVFYGDIRPNNIVIETKIYPPTA